MGRNLHQLLPSPPFSPEGEITDVFFRPCPAMIFIAKIPNKGILVLFYLFKTKFSTLKLKLLFFRV